MENRDFSLPIDFNGDTKEIFEISFKDPVTKGYNSTYFDIEAARRISGREPGAFSFVVLDIVGFTHINDLFGIEVGNKVLLHTYRFLEKYLSGSDMVCRQTGDRFNLLINNDSTGTIDRRQWAPIFELLCDIGSLHGLEALASANMMFMQVKVGIYKIEDTSESLIEIRDKAYTAKRSFNAERVSTHVSMGYYSDYDDRLRNKEYSISHKMYKALEAKKFDIWLQPKLSLKNGCISGAEALVRWRDPELGLVPPAEFIPVMEKFGFVTEIDMYVFEKCCKLLRGWIDKGYTPLRLSSNFSGRHMYNEHFVDDLVHITEQYGVSPTYFEIEFSESMIFEDAARTAKIADKLHMAGFLLSCDDFGSGATSLNDLPGLSLDILKLDRVFFMDTFFPDAGKQFVIDSMVDLGQNLGMEMVVEGVENDVQLQFLCKTGCDTAQGYAISKPLSVSDFEKKFILTDYCRRDVLELADYMNKKAENHELMENLLEAAEENEELAEVIRNIIERNE